MALQELRIYARVLKHQLECPACAHPQAYYELLGKNY